MKHIFIIKDSCNGTAQAYSVEADSIQKAKELFISKAFPIAPDNFTYAMFQELLIHEELDLFYVGNTIKSL